MPIECRFNTTGMSRHQFHELNHVVMRHAFDIQNELGYLCHKTVYQAELIRRCSASGLTVISEGEITVSLDSFSKSYFVDALVASGAVYELKAVCDLTGNHEAQLLNYLFLSNLAHGKLINFASSSVQHRFVTTTIGAKQRFDFLIDESGWDAGVASSSVLRGIVLRLLEEWGAFLDVSLYREAGIHFFGNEASLVESVEIFVEGCSAGRQKMCLLDPYTGLHISSIIRHEQTYKKHLQQLLEHTSLKQMQWLNFNRRKIQLITLKK
jgi:GxxExxY protein